VANLSKTLYVNFYQSRSSIVEVMTNNWCVLCRLYKLASVPYTHRFDWPAEERFKAAVLILIRPHHGSFASVRPSVCLSEPYGILTRKRKAQKRKNGLNVQLDTSNRYANFQFKRSNVRVGVMVASYRQTAASYVPTYFY